jgi:Flp pilus assembly pilin Flp
MLRQFSIDRDGQDLVEYGLLVALAIVGAVAALTGFEAIISAAWTAISTNLAG